MKHFIFFVAFIMAFTATAAQTYSGPRGYLSEGENKKLWSRYCKGKLDQVPHVNYENALVAKAAKKLSKVAPTSFYFYSGPLKAYGLWKKTSGGDNSNLIEPPESAPNGTTAHAHAFLVMLCGEFRDRATMVEAKLKWIDNLFYLPTKKQAAIDPSKNVWSQFSAHSYKPYLRFSSALWVAKKKTNKPVKIGDLQVDAPVDGQTVCETKYIMTNFIAKDKKFDSLDVFEKGLAKFKKENCSKEELTSYYDFRGDSNFKHYSPESNGMIWHANSIANHCKSLTEAKDEDASDEECSQYFSEPFTNRWIAARAGLGAWLLRDKKYDSYFAKESNTVTILPHDEPHLRPYSFKAGGDEVDDMLSAWKKIKGAWTKPDMGFNDLMHLGNEDEEGDVEFAYTRLRDAVNRHTNWYHSAFDDGRGLSRNQAYSPFVASSYEMSQSDNFTQPGTTVDAPSDGRKHWVFVFRVRQSDWYHTQKLANSDEVDFDRMWFDETSLGTDGLAKSERAWDRLGTALEYELDSILYLHNIKESGEVVE
ncbi:MAG: hypothetical protein HY537_18280 [Deltaproteobacteria bacterium]|nr:hypothetical protein [Deltaproteobacteria bacterium]